MKKKMTKNLKKLLAGGIVLAGLSGCMKTPAPGEFREQSLVCIPSLPFATLVKGGKYDFEKIINKDKWVGIKITKHHWWSGKKEPQQILFPEKSTKHGFDTEGFFDMIYISYNSPDGKKCLDMHTTKKATNGYVLKEHYIFNKEKGKYVQTK